MYDITDIVISDIISKTHIIDIVKGLASSEIKKCTIWYDHTSVVFMTSSEIDMTSSAIGY